jgi:hypothetical protein
MDTTLRIIGERLRQYFGDPKKSAMGWNLIDAFTRLEEREEALRRDEDETDGEYHLSLQEAIVRPVNNDN